MLVKTTGIVFRSLKYSETSIIADIYTQALGLRSYIISGVRTKKSKVSAGLLQVMSLVDLVVYHRDDKDLCRIKEIKAAYLFQTIPFNIQKGAIGLFLLEMMQKSIRESEQNEELFDFLFHTIQYLDETTDQIRNFHLSVLVKLSAYLGFAPTGTYTAHAPFFDLQEGHFRSEPPPNAHYIDTDASQLLSQLMHHHLHEAHTVVSNRPRRNALLDGLIDYYRLHIENMPEVNAHKVLKTVLE